MASINRKKLADSVIDEIKRMVSSGELNEGDKLPNQNDFAAQLGVSRTSLREALSTLARLGAIDQRPGYGTVIKSRISTLFTDPLNLPLISDKAASIELVEARRYVEIGAVELAAKNATQDQIEEMRILIDEMASAVKGGRIEEYTEKDVAFHFLVVKASHNRFIMNLFVTLRGLMEEYIREAFHVLPWMVDRSLKYHQSIYQAVKTGNRSKAASQMKGHIKNVQMVIERFYETHRQGNGGGGGNGDSSASSLDGFVRGKRG